MFEHHSSCSLIPLLGKVKEVGTKENNVKKNRKKQFILKLTEKI